uniref:Uncharacterized protein n=1 Tax=Helianthus annuus TaxID=4232 RepID=A0A251U8J2_HELAN
MWCLLLLLIMLLKQRLQMLFQFCVWQGTLHVTLELVFFKEFDENFIRRVTEHTMKMKF